MNGVELLQNHLGSAHWVFANTAADVDEAIAHKGPFGSAGTVGSRMAHLVYDEDLLVQGMLQGKAPLANSTFAGKTGISDPQMNNSEEWAKTVRLNLAEFREYQKAVFAASEAYAASLHDGDLDRELDMSEMGMGKQSLGWAFGMLVIGHANSLAGEISALKGMQGAKGYPF